MLTLWHRSKCSSFFDITCHIQYICVSWILLFGLLTAIFPTGFIIYHLHLAVDSLGLCLYNRSVSWYAVIVLVWLLHQKGFFDPVYAGGGDDRTRPKHRKGLKRSHTRNLQEDYDMHHNGRSHPSHMQKKRRSSSSGHTHRHALQRLDLNDQYQRKNDGHQLARRHNHRSSKGYCHGYRTSRDGPLSREMGDGRDPRKMGRNYEVKQPGRRHSKQLVVDDHRREYEWLYLTSQWKDTVNCDKIWHNLHLFPLEWYAFITTTVYVT